MGGPHRHAAQFFLQNPGILPLETFRSRIAHIRKALMPVQTPQKQLLSVEIKAVFLKFCRPEAHLHLLHIQKLADFQQGYPAGIENGMLRVPGFDHGAVNGNHTGGRKGFAQQLPLPLQQFHQHNTAGGVMDSRSDLQRRQIRGCNVQIFDIAFFFDIQPDFPVQSAISQIVNDKPERRNIRSFPGIQFHCQKIFSSQNSRFRKIHPEAGISAPVSLQRNAVEKHRRNVGRTIELQENMFFLQFSAQLQSSPIAADCLITVVIRIVLQTLLNRMGQPDRISLSLPGFKALYPLRNKLPVVAQTPHYGTSCLLFLSL